MSVVELTKQSHEEPYKFRINHDDAQAVLGPYAKTPKDDKLPEVHTTSNVAILGAGFSGIASSLTCLKNLNETDFVVFDKHDNYGGTWYANTYPGCASDIPAVWYSFFDELNSNWSRLQPPQYEMEEYILTVCKKYDLYKHAKFKTIITAIDYNDDEGTWTLTGRNITNGQRIKHTSRVLLCCQGGLVTPQQLLAPGIGNFKGEYLHSALWDHNVSFKGKKVVVVGNGCSANQLVPALLKDYEPKSIVQVVRSKHYIMPPIPKIVHLTYRLLSFSRVGIVFVRWLIATFAEARFPLYKGNGILARFVRWVNTQYSLFYMKSACPKKFQSMVIPDYKIGCKRLIFDYSYLPSLHDPRVDITNESIDHVDEHSVVMKNGDVLEADIIVACTGYDVLQSFGNYKIKGRNGTDVSKVWKEEGPSAYETILIRDCPNLFMIGGPNSATGHSSVVLAIENGCKYFSKVAPKVLSGACKSICVKSLSYYNWFHTTQKELARSVFGTKFGGCASWYSEGGINSTTYPYSQLSYWWRMRHPKWNDLEVETPYDWNKSGSKAKAE